MHNWSDNLLHLSRLSKHYGRKVALSLYCKVMGHQWKPYIYLTKQGRTCQRCNTIKIEWEVFILPEKTLD